MLFWRSHSFETLVSFVTFIESFSLGNILFSIAREWPALTSLHNWNL